MQTIKQRVLPVGGIAAISAASGLLAGEVAQLFGLQTAAAVFGERLTVYIPLPLFAAMLSTLGPNAKHLYYIGVLIGQGLLTALVGIAYWRLYAAPRAARAATHAITAASASDPRTDLPPYRDALLLIVALWLLSAGLVAPALGGGFFGSGFVGGALSVLLAQLPADGVFAVVFLWRLRVTIERQEATPAAASQGLEDSALQHISRRTVLRRAVLGAGILGAGAFVVRLVGVGLGLPSEVGGAKLAAATSPTRIVPPPTPTYPTWIPVSGVTPEVTTPGNFYTVSKNLVGDPSVDSHTWTLRIDGAANSPYSLTYDQLRALPRVEQYHTLECISNDVGGDLMSNGLFTGVSLAQVLGAAGIKPSVSNVVFTGADGYSDSLLLSQALDPRSLIAYLLDGQPLPKAHGFPARLLIPGLYGMKNGKWLTHLQLNTTSYTGYWEQQGWTPLAHVKLTSRIDTPAHGASLLAGQHWVAGVAYSGAVGISRVEVSIDGGQTWAAARLKRPLGELTWTLWEYLWTATRGTYILGVRAIDLQGNVQTAKSAPPLPDGSSGYNGVFVTVG